MGWKRSQLWLVSHTPLPKHLSLKRPDTLVCMQNRTVMAFPISSSHNHGAHFLFAVNTMNFKRDANEWRELHVVSGSWESFSLNMQAHIHAQTVKLILQILKKLCKCHPLCLSARTTLWWASQHKEPDINTWSASKASCGFLAAPAGQDSFTMEQEKNEKTRAGTVHRLQQVSSVQRASRKRSAVHIQPQVGTGRHNGDPSYKQKQGNRTLPVGPLRYARENCCSFVESRWVLNVLSPMWHKMRQPSICHGWCLLHFSPSHHRAKSEFISEKTCRSVIHPQEDGPIVTQKSEGKYECKCYIMDKLVIHQWQKKELPFKLQR